MGMAYNWDGVEERKRSYGRCYGAYDQQQTPSNLAIWRLHEVLSCALCGKTGTLKHILAGCPISLSQGRYRLHHDMVLGEFEGAVNQARRE
jgi:hypothetical protein